MLKNAICATIITLAGIMLMILGRIDYLIPFKRTIAARYGESLALYFSVLAVNVYATYYFVVPWLLKKYTGKKLSHVQKQIRKGEIAPELTEYLNSGEVA